MLENIIREIIIVLAGITAARYTVYLITSVFYGFSKRKYLKGSQNLSQENIEKKLKISVIVPAWNESVGIMGCIRSLLETTYKNLEIVIVNDGSTDATDEVVKEFLENEFPKYKSQVIIKYIKKLNGGKGSALNAGIKNSSGDLIVTMDADTIFLKTAIFEVAKYFVNDGLDAAVGNVKIANSKSLLGIIQQIEYTVGFYFKRTHSIFNSEYIIGGAFGVFRRDMFDKYGYFDEVIKTEDIEFSTRLQAKGCKIFFLEDAIAYTKGPVTVSGLMKQRLRWKKGRLDTFIKHKYLFLVQKKNTVNF